MLICIIIIVEKEEFSSQINPALHCTGQMADSMYGVVWVSDMEMPMLWTVPHDGDWVTRGISSRLANHQHRPSLSSRNTERKCRAKTGKDGRCHLQLWGREIWDHVQKPHNVKRTISPPKSRRQQELERLVKESRQLKKDKIQLYWSHSWEIPENNGRKALRKKGKDWSYYRWK